MSHAVCVLNCSANTAKATLSLHDALPISGGPAGDRRHQVEQGKRPDRRLRRRNGLRDRRADKVATPAPLGGRSEEHTSELQSRGHLVCRLLLEKNNPRDTITNNATCAYTY